MLDLVAEPAAAALDEQTRAAFAAEFLPWEHGNAATRVIDALGIG